MSSDPEPSRASAIFDSLPYYDNDYERDPTLKDKAEKLIAKELANLKPQQQSQLHPRVPPPITIFAVRAQRSPTATLCLQSRLS